MTTQKFLRILLLRTMYLFEQIIIENLIGKLYLPAKAIKALASNLRAAATFNKKHRIITMRSRTPIGLHRFNQVTKICLCKESFAQVSKSIVLSMRKMRIIMHLFVVFDIRSQKVMNILELVLLGSQDVYHVTSHSSIAR